MNYMTVKEASALWNIDISTIGKLLRAGKIPRATKIGGHWVIPRDTPKVLDGRTKAAKAKNDTPDKNEFFRFPLYVNMEEDSFVPPLSAEEKALRQAELDFLACNFQNAEKNLKKLSENARNMYVQTMSLFWLCLLSAINYNGTHYNAYFMKLEQALADDFPGKPEMALLLPWLHVSLTQYKEAADYFDFNIHYNYSPSVMPLMSYLICADKISVAQPSAFAIRADLYEIAVRQFTDSGNILEALLIHLALFVLYFTSANEERMLFHLERAVEIAYRYNFIYFVADAYPYYTSVFTAVLNDYPQEFADKIRHCGLQIDRSFADFSKNHNVSDMFSLLSNSDIKFVLYAVQGHSNKTVADMLHVSERTVANRYTEIYVKLGVDGKNGMLEMITACMK